MGKNPKRNSHDTVTQGCCDFIGAIILQACQPRKWDKHMKVINRQWARTSLLLSHYCDIMDMDREKIANAIIERNL